MARKAPHEVVAAPSECEGLLLQFARMREKIVWRWSTHADADALEDLRQVARIATWVALDTYNPDRGAALSTHIYYCVVNAVQDEIRAYTRQHSPDVESLDAIPVEIAAVEAGLTLTTRGGDAGESGVFAESIEWDELREAFLLMDARDQAILAAAFGEEVTDGQIAARLAMSVSAVTKRRQRAIHGLAVRLHGAAPWLARRGGSPQKEIF